VHASAVARVRVLASMFGGLFANWRGLGAVVPPVSECTRGDIDDADVDDKVDDDDEDEADGNSETSDDSLDNFTGFPDGAPEEILAGRPKGKAAAVTAAGGKKSRVYEKHVWKSVCKATKDEMGPEDAAERPALWKAWLKKMKNACGCSLKPRLGGANSTRVWWDCASHDADSGCTYMRKVNKSDPWECFEAGSHPEDADLQKFAGMGVGSMWYAECSELLKHDPAEAVLVELQSRYADDPQMYAVIPSIEKLASLRRRVRENDNSVRYANCIPVLEVDIQ
jgi:hypothetical protein